VSGARPGHVADQLLTPRMLEYLTAAAEGLNRKETGARLWVAENTVQYARAHILRRLGARNLTHAVAIAYARGLLPATSRRAELVSEASARLVAAVQEFEALTGAHYAQTGQA
jgi:DNA-binding CsgD family transcriptional regulator